MISGGEDEIPQEEVSELPPEEQELPPEEFPIGEQAEEPALDGEPVAEEGGGSELLSVDELLSTAMITEGGVPEEMLLEAPASTVPTFQLRITQILEEQKAGLKKALEAHGVAAGENTWSAPAPVVSQLTEFQAIQLLQTMRALGVQAHCSVFVPSSAPSEDELALGELLSGPEFEEDIFVESAPSVTLPKGEKDVMLCSPSSLPNAKILETFGLVIAHRSIARRLFREEEVKEKLERELRSVPNRPSNPLASSHLQQVLRDLLLDLRKSSLSKGANAVLGVKIEAFPESSNSDPLLEQLRLVAFGTAAVVEKT